MKDFLFVLLVGVIRWGGAMVFVVIFTVVVFFAVLGFKSCEQQEEYEPAPLAPAAESVPAPAVAPLAPDAPYTAPEAEPTTSTSTQREGDRVCVKVWRGTGFCGTVDRVSGTRLKVEITDIDCGGMVGLCNADKNCSGGRDISEFLGNGAAQKGDTVWIEASCVTSD